MSDDTRSCANTSNKNRKPHRPRILVVSNPGREEGSGSDSEDMKQASHLDKPAYSRRPLPSPGRMVPVNKSQTSVSRVPLPPPLTTDMSEQRHGYYSNPSNPALSSPSSTSSPAVESTPPPSTPGQSATSVDLSDEGTLRPEMVALPTPDRSEGGCQRSIGIMDAPKSPFVRRPHVRKSSQNSRPSSSPTGSTPDAYTPHSQIQPSSSASDSYSAYPHFQPGSSAPSSYASHHYPTVAAKPIEKVTLLVTTNADNFTLVDVSGAMTGAFIRERIFSKLMISDDAQPSYSFYRTEVSKFAIGDALTDEELFELCRRQGDETGTLKLLVSHSSASVHEPLHDEGGTSMVDTYPPPVLPYLDDGLKPRRPCSRSGSRHGSQSSASERITEEAGYEPSVSDDMNLGDQESHTRRPGALPPHITQTLTRDRAPIVTRPKSPSQILPPETPVIPNGTDSPTLPTSTMVSMSLTSVSPRSWVPPATHSQDESLVRYKPQEINSDHSERSLQFLRDSPRRERLDRPKLRDGNPRVDSPGGRAKHVIEMSDERPVMSPEHPQKEPRKGRPTTPQDNSPSLYTSPAIYSPYVPRNRGYPEQKGKSKKSQLVPKGYLLSGTYATPKTEQKPPPGPPHGHRLMTTKSNPNLRGPAYKDPHFPTSLMSGTRHTRQLAQQALSPATSSRPATSTGETSSSYPESGRERPQDARRAGMSPATPSMPRTVASPPFSGATTSVASHLTPVSPPIPEPFPRPRSALDDRGSAQHYVEAVGHKGTDPPEDSLAPRSVRPQLSSHSGSSSTGAITREDALPVKPALSTPPRSPAAVYVGRNHGGVIERGASEEKTGPERTVTRDERDIWDRLVIDNEEGTMKPVKSAQPPSQPLPSVASDDESDSDNEFFMTKPTSPGARLPLSVKVPTSSRGSETLNAFGLLEVPSHTNYASSSRRMQPDASDARGGRYNRISSFDNNLNSTWAPRPPPEAVFERLEEYFPEHDLDRPVIEMPSGGTSPTSTENPIPVPQKGDRRKKSIRVVAAELKKRASRMESSMPAMLRKRNTKLWGSKVEEVTTEAEVPPLPTEASPGGGAKPIFRWIRGELIGKGTYGKVYLALNATTGDMIAVKQVEIPRTASDKSDSRQVTVVEALKLESETYKDLDHPNIVQYLGFEETPTFLSIFLEYVPGGSIASCLRRYGKFEEEVTRSFTGQILAGLEYLHGKGILHRDLKADNILVETNGICKISDFGISRRTDDVDQAGAYTSMQGTVFWMAPEVIDSQKGGYNSKVDIWSVGCVVYEMWTGQRPWNGQEAMAVLLHLYKNRESPPLPENITLSPLATDFRQKCFAIDPNLRPSAADLRQHKYLELQLGWEFPGFQ